MREGRWLLSLVAGASLVTCATGLAFYSSSRGGILFVLVGICLWFAGLGRRSYDTRLVVSFVALLAAGALLFVLSGGTARDRLLGKSAPAVVAPPRPGDAPAADDRAQNPSEDFRLKIFRDAFDLVRDYPLTGAGLGNFALVFPQYRHASLDEVRVLHPESDWLMLAAEAGVPAVVCLLALLGLALRRLKGETGHPYWPLRWGCLVAVGAAVLHGVVDVPLHRVQLGWWVLAVGGLALQSFQFGKIGRSRLQHALFVVAGAGALVLGGMMVRAEWFGGKPLPPFVVGEAQKEVAARLTRHDLEGATDLARETVNAHPMNPSLYLQLGALLLQSQDTDAEVDALFKVQRLLDPNWPAIPLRQGEVWMSINADRTVALWLDALARRRRIDHATGRAQDDSLSYYSEILGRAAPFPEVWRKLIGEATHSPAYAFAWLDNAGPQIDPADWETLAKSTDLLNRFSEPQRQRFLLLWHGKGDRAALGRFMAEHPDWRTASWPVHLRQLTEAGQFETAAREAADRYKVSLELPASDPSAALAAPTDESDPARAFAQDWKDGNTIGARRVLAEADTNAAVSKTAEFYRLKAALAVHDAKWPEAWASLRQAISTEHPDVNF